MTVETSHLVRMLVDHVEDGLREVEQVAIIEATIAVDRHCPDRRTLEIGIVAGAHALDEGRDLDAGILEEMMDSGPEAEGVGMPGGTIGSTPVDEHLCPGTWDFDEKGLVGIRRRDAVVRVGDAATDRLEGEAS